MQHELNLRLIKDGEIVGYIRYAKAEKFKGNRIRCLCAEFDGSSYKVPIDSLEVRCESHVYETLDPDMYNDIDFDSFEIRSPFKDKNDQWLWEGDIIQNTSSKQKSVIKYGKWKSYAGAGCGFYNVLLTDVDGIPISFHPNQEHIEKTGTIHDDLKGVDVE